MAESVALSADGSTALIGGPEDNIATGAAWVFTHAGGEWNQQGSKLTGGEEDNTEFGVLVSLSADGNTALIGGWKDEGTTGAAWVFTRSGGVWSQQGPKLTGGGESGEGGFGTSVALSADGNTALIGAPGDNFRKGAAWVFTRSGSTWTQQGRKADRHGRERVRLVRLHRRALGRRQNRADRRLARQQLDGRGVGIHALRIHLDPAGRKTDRLGRDRRRHVRHQRRALRRRQHGADRRLERRKRGIRRPGLQRQGRGLGLHALGIDLDPAGAEADPHGRDRERQVRHDRRALRRRQHGADRRLERRHQQGRGLGVRPLRRGVEPAGAEANRCGRGRRRQVRRGRRALRRRRQGAGRSALRQQHPGRGLGVHADGLDLDPGGRKADRRRRVRRRRIRH